MSKANPASPEDLSDTAKELYRTALSALERQAIPHLVGGSFATQHYTDRAPTTKDLDLFLPPEQLEAALGALADQGFQVSRPFPHWIAKAALGDEFVDLIFRAASGVWTVETAWVERAERGQLLGMEVPVCPLEELIWSKATLLDRTRYDGNDVLHLLQSTVERLDWERLRALAGEHWRILLAHLTLFGYVYPDLAELVPRQLLAALALRLVNGQHEFSMDGERLCRGTLVSNSDYLYDVERLGYSDARLQPWGILTREELEPWIEAVKEGRT